MLNNVSVLNLNRFTLELAEFEKESETRRKLGLRVPDVVP